MNADSIYLGAFAGALSMLFCLNLALVRLTGNKKFMLVDLVMIGVACFFIVNKHAVAEILHLSDTKAWMLANVCPLLVSLIAASYLVRLVTGMKEAAPRADGFLNFITALQIFGVLAFVSPLVVQKFGPPGMDTLIEAKLIPLGFTIFIGITAVGWLLSILMTPAQLGESRATTLFSVLLFAVFLVSYALMFYGVIPLDESMSNDMRLAVLGSLVCFTFAVYHGAQFSVSQKTRARSEQRERASDWKDKQVSRQQINQAHLMQVLKHEKELEAQLRARETEQMEALKAAKEAADEMARNKAQFLAFMSHEIRTPLNGIMGMVRLLMTTDVSEQQRDYIQTLNYSGDALLALVNDTLDISKIEAGQMVLERIDFDLQRLVSSIIMLMSARASEKNLLIRSDIAAVVPRFIKGDPTRLRQILLNLINNAIKFTEEGGVTVAVRLLAGAPQGSSRLRFEVQDTGPGISEEGCQRLFKEYSQVDASTTRLYGGTGLGLSICKQLVQAMEGEIGVTSVVSQGSTFWFFLDFEASAGDNLGEMTAKTPGTPVLSAMVVEDNEIHQKVIGGYLRLDGHNVTMVGSAEDALQAFAQRHFDVLLMDVNLPGMDGNEATRRIRSNPDPVKASVPIIAITGNTSPIDIDGCRAAGMDDFVGKPVDPDALRTTVFATHKAWKERQAESGHGPALPAAGGVRGPLKILVVDDNQINQKVISGFLAAGGHEIVAATSGEKGLSLATSTRFDLILMDVTLPGIDGLEASRRIRALPDAVLRAVPIIAITGNTSPRDVEECRAAGMNDFLGKPIDPDALETILERLHRPATAATVSLDDYLPEQSGDIQLLDETVLRRLTKAFDGAALSGLIDDMLRESLPLIRGMVFSVQENDLAQLRVQAHTLKGMAMTLGVTGVGELAADIESSVQRGEAREVLSAMAARLEQVFDQSEIAIQRWRDETIGQLT